MDDDVKRLKYIRLKNNVIRIKSKISNLNYIHNRMINIIEATLLIDGKILDNEKINNIRNNTKNIESEISNNIIPSINRKI